MNTSAPCKQTQHCCLVTPNILGCYMLRRTPCWMLLHVVACCAKFETGQTFEPTFVSWSPTYSATTFSQLFQHCWGHARALHMVSKFWRVVSFSRCTVNPNIVGSCCIRLHTPTNTHATTPNITLLFHLISRVLNFAKNRTSEQTNSNNRKNNFIVHNSHPRRPRGSQ